MLKKGRFIAGVSLACALMATPAMSSVALADNDKDDSGSSGKCVVAIDPGHNGVKVDDFDEKTGAKMTDYPNEAEDADVMEVSKSVKEALEDDGMEVVLLKEDVGDNVSYRERVDKAKDAGADVAVSIHTTPGVNYSMVIAQNVGGYREGATESGETKRVTFENADVAKKSQDYAKTVADARTKAEPNPVKMTTSLDFGGREGLWSGNLPIIQLLSEDVPWIYSEYGTDNGGGVNPIGDDAKKVYAEGLSTGLKEALSSADCGGGKSDSKSDDDDKDKDNKDSKKDKDKNTSTSKSTSTSTSKSKSKDEDRPTKDENGNKIKWSEKTEDGVLVVTKTVIVEK